MANVPVAKLKNGSKLSAPVFTKKGNLLFTEGKTITEREKEILQAFLISSVSIEGKGEAAKQVTENDGPHENLPVSSAKPATFSEEIKQMRTFLQQIFNLARSNHALPILEIRTRLIQLLRHIDEYHLLLNDRDSLRDEQYLYNSIHVAMTSYLLAKWHGFPQKDWLPIAMGGLLYNIGNVKVDPAIFEKKTALTDKEREEMRKHTIYGYQIIKDVPAVNEGVKFCALQHHEREDGSGYPMGVPGDKIHPYAKIVAIADIYHAMTSNRSYKQAESPYLVLDQLWEESFGKLDPAMVRTFIRKVTSFTTGTIVKLNDGTIGEIVFSDQATPTRPLVKAREQIINLSKDRQLYIQQVLSSE
jgi:HD-GYP domain-containing protein (c-di-GMP phosphodiesterase class II)